MGLDSRERLLLVMKILEEHCSGPENITMEQIIDQLANESGCSSDRKAIYKDIDAICAATNLRVERKTGMKDYRVSKANVFSKEEVEIITNAMLTAKFISKAETSAIIKKLHQSAGLSRAKTGAGSIILQDPVKPPDAKVLQNIKIIKEAIQQNKKLQFDYVKYNSSKKRYIEKERCLVSPYVNVWYQDFYYMLGSFDNERISHYRADRMTNIQLTYEARKSITDLTGSHRQFDVYEYLGKMVGMSSENHFSA